MPMNADLFPTEIALVLLVELLFGIGYNALARDIAEKSKADTISLRDLPDYVDKIHGLIGSLKTL